MPDHLGITLWLMGSLDQAAGRMHAALALAAELEHPYSTAYAQFHAGLLRLLMRDGEGALDLATELLELSEDHEFRIWLAAGGCLLGAAQIELGRLDEGLHSLHDGIERYRELRSPPIFWPFLLFLNARASLRAGDPAVGLAAVESAIDFLSQGQGSSLLSEVEIVKGDLLATVAARDGMDTAPADEWYAHALDRALRLGARTAQLRAASRLARSRQASGNSKAGLDLLRPVYDAFTEGFSFPDLVEAEALLASLDIGEAAQPA